MGGSGAQDDAVMPGRAACAALVEFRGLAYYGAGSRAGIAIRAAQRITTVL
jgi:hypothetical protein